MRNNLFDSPPKTTLKIEKRLLHKFSIMQEAWTGLLFCCKGWLLHDFFLYDWHADKKTSTKLHGFVHLCIAVKNANEYFSLNNIEKDIIEKHMPYCIFNHNKSYSYGKSSG